MANRDAALGAMGNAEQQKYDRQLRLWGVHGQKRLMNSHVCLLNAGPTGTEALKNLVLPGIGRFTVVDGCMVSDFDCANNFFVDRTFIGKSRALAVTSLLSEMNGDVKGFAVQRDPREVIKNDPKFFSSFSLVIATQLDEQNLVQLGEACIACEVPLVVARTYGLIGHVRLFSSEHRVIELKPSPEPAPDLRVFNPWPDLKALSDTINFENLDGFEFKHVPFVFVLMKTMDRWKELHDGKVPENYAQKEEFKKTIKGLARDEWGMEENLVEAMNNAFQAFTPFRINEDVLAVLNDKCAKNLDNSSSPFWIMAAALRDFYNENKVLPLPGTLPDMTATTDRFVQLQTCFAAKAKQDANVFNAKVDSLLKVLGRPVDFVSPHDRNLFCSNASGVVAMRSRSLKEEYTSPKGENDFGFDDPTELPEYMNPIVWYLMWRACDAYFEKEGSYPGSNAKATETDLASYADQVLAIAKALQNKHYQGIIPARAVTKECAEEMIRYGAVEIHNVAALIGGIAAEESVKLLTQQYQPLNNTFLFNGICAVGKYYSM